MGGCHRENTTQEKPNFRRKNMKLENSKPKEEKEMMRKASLTNT